MRYVAILLLLCCGHVHAAEIAAESIYVSEIRLEGPELLSETEVVALTRHVIGRQNTFAELAAVRQQLTEAIINKGYLTSGVTLPDQEVRDGVVMMRVSANSLGDVQVSGTNPAQVQRIQRIIAEEVDGPLHLADISRTLALVESLPRIQSISGRLLPGADRGDSVLALNINESPRRSLTVQGNNYRSPGIGEHTGEVAYVDSSFANRGDRLTAATTFGEGAENYFLSYEALVHRSGLRIGAYAQRQDLDIVEEPFDDLDIVTENRRYGVTASLPLIASLNREVTAFVELMHEETDSELLGQAYSFSLGDVNGESQSSVISAGVEWGQLIGTNRFAFRGAINKGIRILSATNNHGDLPDSSFTSLLLQGQYVRDLNWWRQPQLSVRLTGQWTEDPLLSQHKMSVGGRYSVRGYRENQLVRDNAVAGAVELRVPVSDDGRMTVVPFFDFGIAWDDLDRLETSEKDDIQSVGLGFLWAPMDGLSMEAFYAESLNDVDNPTSANQERGFHYQLRYQYQF